MSSDNPANEVIGEFGKLEQALASEHDSRKRVSRAAQTVTVLLSCTILFFVLVNYIHFRNHWTEENFKHSLQKEFSELSPLALRQLNAAGKELLPVYARESQKQLNDLMPEIARTMRRELDAFCEDILASTHANLAESQENILKQTEKTMFEQYPGLKDSARREELRQSFEKLTQDSVRTAVLDFDRSFSTDVETLKASLLKFDLKDSDETTVELQKKFLRLWLQLLDEEIKEL